MNNISYAASLTIILYICVFSIFFCVGCNCQTTENINMDKYNLQTTYPTPQYKTQVISQLSNIDDPYISANNNQITFFNPEPTNYVIENFNGYNINFTTPTMLTINNPSVINCNINSTTTLDLIINCTILSEPAILETTPATSLIVADTLNVYGSGGKLLCSDQIAITCSTLNIYCQDLFISTNKTAINCDNLYIFTGKIQLKATNMAINCINLYQYGGNLEILDTKTAILCKNLDFANGILNIKAIDKSIICQNINKRNGFICICSKNGIDCKNISISQGYLYANCTLTALKAQSYINYGGNNIFISTTKHYSATEVPQNSYKLTGGVVVSCSDILFVPNSKYLAFKANKNQAISLSNTSTTLVYIPQYNTNVIILYAQNYKYFSNKVKINNRKNFYGLLTNANAESSSIQFIKETTEFYVKTYKIAEMQSTGGQLL